MMQKICLPVSGSTSKHFTQSSQTLVMPLIFLQTQTLGKLASMTIRAAVNDYFHRLTNPSGIFLIAQLVAQFIKMKKKVKNADQSINQSLFL